MTKVTQRDLDEGVWDAEHKGPIRILSISLTDKTHLQDLFDKTNFNDVKDQFSPLIPGVSLIIKRP